MSTKFIVSHGLSLSEHRAHKQFWLTSVGVHSVTSQGHPARSNWSMNALCPMLLRQDVVHKVFFGTFSHKYV